MKKDEDGRKKFLFILHLPPPIHGASMMGKYIKESSLINTEFNIDYINLSTSNQITSIGKSDAKKIISIIKLQISIIAALLKTKYNLCYVTISAKGPGFYKDLLIVLILKLFRQNIIFHFHNKGVLLNSKNKLNDFLYKFVFKNTKSIVLSKSLEADTRKYIPAKNLSICPNGIPEITNLSIKDHPAHKNEIPKLLFLSNMMPEKGIFVLLSACKLLKEKGILFECHAVGDWGNITEEAFNSEVEHLNLNRFVFAHGKKYNADKITFFKEATIFVFPTYYNNECFPLVLLEAMQFGLPIISTPEGGIQDIVVNGETGFLVPQKNHIALAEKIELLINQPELSKKMGVMGMKRYKELFTLAEFENTFCKILKQA